MKRLSVFAKDAWERVLSTLVQAFLATFSAALVGSSFFEDLAKFDLNEQALGAATVAGVASVLALVKAYIAKNKPDTVSPASLASNE